MPTKQHKDITGDDLHINKLHSETHENGGTDEISVAGLSGVLADKQDADKIQAIAVDITGIGDGYSLVYSLAQNKWIVSFAVTSFLTLSDTPNSYSGQKGKYVRINDAESALEFEYPKKRLTDAQRDAITGWEEGDEIFNLDVHRPQFFDGIIWQTL